MKERPTRGNGLLEPLLADLRARKANSLIPVHSREGRILDIGCGSYPYFLSHTAFSEKFGIDQHPRPQRTKGITWHTLDLNQQPILPYDDTFFDVVSMLAVAEHLDPSSLISLFIETYRCLKPGGRIVITTPATWSQPILEWMAKFKLVSATEIDEHIFAYTLPLLGWCFGKAGFRMNKIRFGYFEFRLNLWAYADR